MRTPIIAGNWKMHKTVSEAVRLCKQLQITLGEPSHAEVVVCPPFTVLSAVAEVLRESYMVLGGQDVYWEPEGAFTGAIAPGMLADVGCRYCIVGHSERRQYFGETDEDVSRKVGALLAGGLRPILCVGEDLTQREAGATESFVSQQVRAGLAAVDPQRLTDIVIAYEPIWAIGTGVTATPSDAGRVAQVIRQVLAEMSSPEVAAAVRIQYGGSVKPDNSGDFMQQPDIDGALVGGASLDAASFAEIVKFPRIGEETST